MFVCLLVRISSLMMTGARQKNTTDWWPLFNPWVSPSEIQLCPGKLFWDSHHPSIMQKDAPLECTISAHTILALRVQKFLKIQSSGKTFSAWSGLEVLSNQVVVVVIHNIAEQSQKYSSCTWNAHQMFLVVSIALSEESSKNFHSLGLLWVLLLLEELRQISILSKFLWL